MAKKKSGKETTKQAATAKKVFNFLKSDTLRFLAGLVLVLFSVYLLLAFTSYFFTGAADQSIIDGAASSDLSATNNKIRNYAGSRGAQLASYLINDCFGLASFFIIIFCTVSGLKLMKVRNFKVWKWFIGCSLLLIWFSLFLGFVFTDFYADSFFYWGGRHGYNVSAWIVSQIGIPGMWLLLFASAIGFFIYVSSKTVIWIRDFLQLKFMKSEKKEEVPETFTGNVDDLQQYEAPVQPNLEDEQPFEIPLVTNPGPVVTITKSEATTKIEADPDMEITIPKDDEGEAEDDIIPDNGPQFQIEANEDETYQGPETEPYNPKLDLENYKFPTMDLLRKYDNNELTVNMEEQKANKERIISTLRSFGIEISTIKATVGPTVTLYEITPEQGVRISKIRGLEDDIALSLSALGIRIIAPIPGKGTIGIEVPNSNPKIVAMQSIIGSKKFQESSYDLPIALGKTITNEVFMVDLAKMPHVLVAGATGQGKSVGLNAIITSLLYKKHPAELKFVLVDPKKVEFSIYSAIENHFLAKLPDGEEAIITDVTKVVQTLNSLCVEMDSRYDLLKKAHVRNIKEYNDKFINRRLNPEKGHRFMPYIVVIIDEFGDLIMTAGKEVELPIARIAQLARAVGIHMIIATQRPTTNIITGTIKANFPARVAFRVSAMMDSRTILDRPGANQLIGRGDMLFLQGADPVRVQCAFVDTPEVEDIARYISRQQSYPTAFYLPEYVSPDASSDVVDVDMTRLDPLFEEAARLIVVHQQGSTSLIQRKFSIGYNRAGRIMDQLEKAGIVGPSEGSKARQVMCLDENDLEMRLSSL